MRRTLASLVPTLVVALLACAATAARAAETVRITVLHTTDVHGSLLPWDDLLDKPAARGLALAATRIAKVRAEGHPVLLLDAGDAMAGSPLVSVWQRDPGELPHPVATAMNELGYDAMAVGNHEFDYGPAGVEGARAASRFPWLAANIVRRDGSPAFAPSLVKELDGVRIGVVGLCTPAVPLLADSAAWAGHTFLSPFEIARKEVSRLRGAERCDVVIALAHTGLEKHPRTGEPRKGDATGENFGHQLASEVPGLDAVILAHTHEAIPFANIGGTVVTQAGKHAEGLGRLDFSFTRETPASAWKLEKRPFASYAAFGDSTAADTAFAAKFAPYAERTKAALDVTVAQAEGELAAPYGRFSDNALWQLVHRAQLEASGADVSLAALFAPEQRIPAGAVRVRDLMRLYPYENSLVTLELTGAELEAALEQSARYLATYTYEDGRPLAEPGMPGWNFDMAHGVTYDVDLTKPPGERIGHLAWKGQPLAPEQKLRVVVNGYRAAGGGDFAMLRRARVVGRPAVNAPEAVLAHARRAGRIAASVDPAWTLVPDYAGAPERALIDRLVRLGIAPKEEVRHLIPNERARRVDLAYWLGRAFGWKSNRPSGAFGDVPDELEPWLDGILAKGVLGPDGKGERFDPFRPASVLTALDWSERCARRADYSLATLALGDEAFWRSLVTGVSLKGEPGRAGIPFDAVLTRAQWLGMLSNLRFPRVRVMETTDFHGAILGGQRDRRTGRPIGGSPALAAIIEHYRGQNPEGTVLVDGGDIFQGTMISNLQFGRPVVEQMNALGYAAAAIGNHEFDWTADTLKSRVLNMRFAALGANMLERKTNKRPWWVRSDTTVARRGVKVGIFGLAYPGTPRVTMPAYVAHLRFADDSATSAPLPARLRKQGAALVVAVGHIPAETDSTRRARGDIARLAHGIRGVDGWFGGHSHNVVDDVIGNAPVMVAGANGQWLAIADYTVDPLARAVVAGETSHRILQVFADEFPIDTAWTARVERWNADVGPVAATVLGRSTNALDRNRPEATIGNFICDAMRFSSGADIALQNPGGMRANMSAGTVTRAMVYDVMPFDNTIVTMELTGAEVRRALEQALRGDRITQVSGLHYVVNPDAPPMQRVVSMTNPDGTPFDEQKTYKVAANNFMASGGDSYDALGQGRNRSDSGFVIRGAMEAFVIERSKSGGALEIKTEGRIRVQR